MLQKSIVPARPGTNFMSKFSLQKQEGEFNFLCILAESVFTLGLVENSFKDVRCLTIHTFLINEVQLIFGLCFGLKNPEL